MMKVSLSPSIFVRWRSRFFRHFCRIKLLIFNNCEKIEKWCEITWSKRRNGAQKWGKVRLKIRHKGFGIIVQKFSISPREEAFWFSSELHQLSFSAVFCVVCTDLPYIQRPSERRPRSTWPATPQILSEIFLRRPFPQSDRFSFHLWRVIAEDYICIKYPAHQVEGGRDSSPFASFWKMKSASVRLNLLKRKYTNSKSQDSKLRLLW